MLDQDKLSLLDKTWALFMSDPVTFITIFGVVVASVSGFVWWFRGHIDKERLEARDERLQLARDQVTNVKTDLETAKKDNQELKEKLAQFISIDPQALNIRDLANGTASAIDQALIANNELRSTLGPSDELRSIYASELRSIYASVSGWLWDRPQRTWRDRISGCFGDKDGWFASHPLDEKRAIDLIRGRN